MAVDDGKTERDSRPSLVEAAFWAALELFAVFAMLGTLGLVVYAMFGAICR